jgi:hypothetical protein
MAHPDHDQVIGRLAGARLRGSGARRSGAAASAHPDAETWAAYVDGGLPPEEVRRLEDHLGGCRTCRQLVGALMPEVSAAPIAAGRDAEATPAHRAAVFPFPRRQVLLAWMGIAAALLMAVTLWSVSRLGSDARVSEMAGGVATPDGAPSTAASDARRDDVRGAAASAPRAEVAAPVDRPDETMLSRSQVARAEQDKATAAMRARDALARQRIAATPAAAGATSETSAGATAPSQEKRPATAAPAAASAIDTRQVQPQRNAVAAGAARAQRLPANQAVPPQPQRQQAPVAQPPAPAPPAPSIAGGAGARDAGDASEAAAFKDERANVAAFASSAAAPVFAEPGGRLHWRIVEGRRLESSSDGGVTWTARAIPRGARLRAGAAPAIDTAWAVGERGLVLRLSVPGGWTAVTPPGPVTLVSVSATDARSARVTAADGQVFETADGGATWTPAAPGAGPQ